MLSAVTGLPERDWVAIAVVALALILIVRSLAVPAGDTLRHVSPVPAIAGLIMMGALPAFSLLSSDLVPRLASNLIALVAVAALAVAAFALTDFLFLRVVPPIRTILQRLRFPRGATLHAALALALAPVVAASAFLAWRTNFATGPTAIASLVSEVEEFDLPGDPLGIAMISRTTGYATVGQGSVVRFELPDGTGQLRQTTVADGLEFPRGIAIANNRLYVVEVGSLPCRPAYPTCVGEQVGVTAMDGERTIVKTARGRISSYAIGAEGSLSDQRSLLRDLPVMDSLHAVNGLAFGPDHNLYLSIGNVDALWDQPSIDQGATPHPEWLGTVLRVDPASGQAEVFARGLRNVYGLAFDDRGGLWGVDNSGRAHNDRRAEELLQIKQGRNYGYPMDGTFGVWSQRDDHPVWTIDAAGSAGIRWAGDAAMEPGVFLGSCGRLSYLRLHQVDGRWSVQNPDVDAVQGTPLLNVSGCVTDVAALGPRTILASVFNFGGGGKLLRITLSGNGD
jgi:glucose/arabinose dehydrogenase